VGEVEEMAMFVHLAPETVVAKIRKNGIRRLRKPWSNFPGGVFAVPLTKHFYYTHQWLRELKRGRKVGLVQSWVATRWLGVFE
jgi:hypothetical protein